MLGPLLSVVVTISIDDIISQRCSPSDLSLLIFPDYLPVAWIGNVMAITTLKSTLGDTVLSTKDVFVPMLPISMIGWGISMLLGRLSTQIYSILLPFVVLALTLIIILCPWPYLTMKNLMLLILYLILASPLSLRYSGFDNDSAQEELSSWFVPGLVGTCTIGLCVALLVHIMLMVVPRSTTASRLAPKLMNQLTCETHQLLLSLSEYMQNLGKASSISRQSRTLIEFYVKSRSRTLGKLDSYLPAMRAEKNLSSVLPISLSTNFDTVEDFVACAKKQQKHAELIRLATTQQFLGEDYTSMNEAVRGVKTKMSDNLGAAVEQIAMEYTMSEYALFFDTSDINRERTFNDLQSCMESYRSAMGNAITDAELMLLNDDEIGITLASRSTTAGPLIRSRVVFHAVFSFVHELRDMITCLAGEKPAEVATKTITSKLRATLKMPWLWNDLGKRRLAMKTALGLSFASLWVSIPSLRGYIAYPNSVWVGLTVASVSLESTGAAYTKCLDRLWATLIAAAYALLIGKIVDPNNGIVKLLALSAFTFGATLLTNPARPYASRYAATSVGSILFGSFANNVEVHEYVPNRIMLIFIGVATFLFVEMIVFPRSSRTIVQAQSIQFFEDLEHFLFDSGKVCGSISSFHKVSSNVEEDDAALDADDPIWMLRQGHKKMTTFTHDLTADTVKSTVALAKSELRPGIAEPSLGLNVGLDIMGYENLLMEQDTCQSQLDLLIITIKSLIGYYTYLPDNHPARSLHWPTLLSASLVKLAEQLSDCTDKLRSVFPNGLCRPGNCEVSKVIRAVASFRNFEDTRLAILSDIGDRQATYLNMISLSGEAKRYTSGFRVALALAASAILTIGESLENCGKHLETIVQSFPIEEVNVTKGSQQAAATLHMGSDVG